MYTFGYNEYYQCGTGNDKDVLNPTLNETLKNKNIKTIKAGAWHNMAVTHDGRHFFWGSNHQSECLMDKPSEYVKFPTFAFQDQNGKIKKVFLGWKVTEIVISGQHLFEVSTTLKSIAMKTKNFFGRLFTKRDDEEDEKQNVRFIHCQLTAYNIIKTIRMTQTTTA